MLNHLFSCHYIDNNLRYLPSPVKVLQPGSLDLNNQISTKRKGRLEDIRFVSGYGKFTADLVPSDALHAVFLRSPFAIGTLNHLDCSDAKKAPGVVAVLTALDATEDGIANMI